MKTPACYYAAHPDKKREHQRKWRAANPENPKNKQERNCKYHAANPEKERERRQKVERC